MLIRCFFAAKRDDWGGIQQKPNTNKLRQMLRDARQTLTALGLFAVQVRIPQESRQFFAFSLSTFDLRLSAGQQAQPLLPFPSSFYYRTSHDIHKRAIFLLQQ